MSDTAILISALATAPGVIIPLIREVPPRILKRRPSPAKWSAYEHACHLSQSDAPFLARLDLILSTPEPYIESIENSPEDEVGAMLDIDLDESLDRYVRERAALVERLKRLSPDEWQKTAEHEASRSLFGMDHVPASAQSRDAPRLPDRRAAAQEGLGLDKLFRRQASRRDRLRVQWQRSILTVDV